MHGACTVTGAPAGLHAFAAGARGRSCYIYNSIEMYACMHMHVVCVGRSWHLAI